MACLDDRVDDVDDTVGGDDVELDDGGRAGLGADGDGLGIPEDGDLLATSGLQGSGALGHVLGLQENMNQ